MCIVFIFLVWLFLLSLAESASARTHGDTSGWTVYITNDNCPDYTWGFTEEQTRQSFADIVRAHLDEMKRTDAEAEQNRDRYNMPVTQEALCFVERYPEREDELVQRIRESRIYVSPYLCNSLWAFQSFEGAVRVFYPARRLERKWGISFDVAEHIEEPSLPWGVASILAGCGIRWLSNPFYKYDSTFTELRNPPVFIFEGPDGSQIRVAMDPWACGNSSYTQGARLLRDPSKIEEWLAHYQQLGESYPLQAILASGTHGDISPRSGGQAPGFANAVIEYNNSPGDHPKLVNAILPQFCDAVDKVQAERPFLKVIRGSFGHSWDVWPVCLAKYVADMREGERAFLSAEALLTIASHVQPDLAESTRSHREQGEWLWAMLSDHAWNGTDENNKRHNAELRRKWSQELKRIGSDLIQQGWNGLKAAESDSRFTIFNSISVPRADLVRVELPTETAVFEGDRGIDSQMVEEDGKRVLYFVSPEIPGFGLRQLNLRHQAPNSPETGTLRATSTELESPYYRLVVDTATGGISSLTHKPTGVDLVVGANSRTLCQTVYFCGQEHLLTSIKSEAVADGPILARLRVTGIVEGACITNFITVYAHLDRVDFGLHITKPVTTGEERLCHVFPVLRDGAILRVETTGAVIRPELDLLTGADTRRFAVQGFIDASLPGGLGVTIAPLDAFVLRMDLEPITFEALGNDQNYREVVHDQNRETDFRFRYSLRAHTDGYSNAEAFTWSRSVSAPLLATKVSIEPGTLDRHSIGIDPDRAFATCLKPADENGYMMRLWEIGGKSGPVSVDIKGYRRAFRTDLLERDIEELRIADGKANLDIRPYGFAGLRLMP